MASFESADLLSALLQGRRIDGSHTVLARAPPQGTRPQMPPFVQAAYQLAEFPTTANPDDTMLTLADFERLSLAARARLLNIDATGMDVDLHGFPSIEASALMDAMSQAAALLEPGANACGLAVPPSEIDRLHTRGGLQIVGCRIVGGDAPTLRLVNGHFPFSLRLIGCVIECPIIANNCDLVSLDLSGSALVGLDATFIKAKGSVRLRRTLAVAPIDFSGAVVNGVFDASDSIVLPSNEQPANQAFAADRGALNLSQATIHNELYLSRARVWGGLSLKGTVVDRSIFMDDAILRSPMGVLTMLALGLRARKDPPSPELQALRAQDDFLGWRLHQDASPNVNLVRVLKAIETSPTIAAHTLGPRHPLYRLLSESMRARTSAVRADGLRVAGSVFARGMRASGRVRIRYAKVDGGLHLDEAWLWSANAVAHMLASLEDEKDDANHFLFELRHLTERRAQDAERAENDDFAVDIRDATFGGNVSFGRSRNGTLPPLTTRQQIIRSRTSRFVGAWLDGVFAATRAQIRGTLDFSRVLCVTRSKDRRAAHYSLIANHIRVGNDVDFRNSKELWGANLENATVEGSIIFSDKIDVTRLTWVANKDRGARAAIYNRATFGVGSQSGVGRSWPYGCEINLRGANIRGDCRLLFSPVRGPDLKAELAKVGGRLDILPAAEDGQSANSCLFSHGIFMQGNQDAKARRTALKALARSTEEWWTKRLVVHHIDLRGASAATFCHPPMAWPLQEGLSISGFSYRRAHVLGPLAPFPFPPQNGTVTVSRAVAGLAFIFTFGILWTEAGFAALAGRTAWAAPLAVEFGLANVSLLSFVAVAAAFVTVTRQLPPQSIQSKPMGAFWLQRQLASKNQYRRPGRIYWPLEPYIQAAKVLREEGRPISANIIEVERLKQRTNMLSGRLHLPMKVGMRMVEWLANYGFRISRAIWVTMLLIIVAAMLSHQAEAHGWLRPKPDAINESSAGRPRFVALAYAADVIVPFLDLGVKDQWVAGEPAKGVVHGALTDWTLWKWLLGTLGLFFTTIIAAAIATRAQSVLGRSEE